MIEYVIFQVETLTGVELSPEACVPLEETTPKESGPKTVQGKTRPYSNFIQPLLLLVAVTVKHTLHYTCSEFMCVQRGRGG